MSGAKVFDKLLEKTTSPLLLEVDWQGILSICDLIRQGDVPAKYVISQLKKKMNNENIHVSNFSLQCLESIVKNCGSKVHQEVATKDFMDSLRTLAGTKGDPVKTKVLELIQCWSHAFKKNPNYKIVEDYYNAMKLEGFQYPPLKESEAMFDVDEAPAWKDDSECSNCFRCRAEFSTLRRRHHCRACGQIFCHACSSKTASIPKYGIEKEVRVCDVCYDKVKQGANTVPGATGVPGAEGLPIEYVNSPLFKESVKEAQKKPAEKSEQEFEEELQLALALSQSEAEAQESSKRKKNSSSTNNSAKTNSSSSMASKSSSEKLNKQKSWTSSESGSVTQNASAPYEEPAQTKVYSSSSSKLDEKTSNYNEEEEEINREIDDFVEEVKKILELYINRMKSDSIRGRSITNDTAVQSLFLQLQHLHPKLLSYIKYQEDARGYYENLQDKLTQLKDAREALNALRHENYEKKKRELEEQERLRQMQIAQKLQYMRQQKQKYYLYQNQLNLQRLQEHEKEIQMRLSQQRDLVLQRDQQLFQAGMNPNQPGMPYQDPAYAAMNPNQYVPMVNALNGQQAQYTNGSNGLKHVGSNQVLLNNENSNMMMNPALNNLENKLNNLQLNQPNPMLMPQQQFGQIQPQQYQPYPQNPHIPVQTYQLPPNQLQQQQQQQQPIGGIDPMVYQYQKSLPQQQQQQQPQLFNQNGQNSMIEQSSVKDAQLISFD